MRAELPKAATAIEALQLADDPTKGESGKKGAESIKDFKDEGMSRGTTITPADHGGSRFVRMYRVKNGELVLDRDWVEGPRTKSTAAR